jgi:hypothetical protein
LQLIQPGRREGISSSARGASPARAKSVSALEKKSIVQLAKLTKRGRASFQKLVRLVDRKRQKAAPARLKDVGMNAFATIAVIGFASTGRERSRANRSDWQLMPLGGISLPHEAHGSHH